MRPSYSMVFIALSLITTNTLFTASTRAVEPCQSPTTTAPTTTTAHVQLSELYPSPSDGKEEFIEIYNASSTTVDLTGWGIEDASGKIFTISNNTIPAGEYRAFPFSQTKIYLNNNEDTVTLLRPDASIADTTTYSNAPDGESWAAIANTWQWTTTVTANAVNVTGTSQSSQSSATQQTNTSTAQQPTTPQATTTETTESSDTVTLNELLPNPTGSETTDEWIELYNSSDAAINLNKWQLTDQTRYYTITDTRIPAHGYVVFESSETHINLNNTGDTVYLIDPTGAIKNGTTYEIATEDTSWAHSGSGWVWATPTTPGKQNIVAPTETKKEEEENIQTTPNALTEFSIIEAQQQPDSTTMSITGIVSVIPNTFSTQYFYIQDSTGGIQVYSYSKQFPELAVGDLVVVNGEKSSITSESRIKTRTAEDIAIGNHNNELTTQEVTSLEEAAAGILAHITGTVTNATSTKAVLDDTTAVSIKSTSGVTKKQFPIGETVSVTGIIVRTDDSSTIVPRSPLDVELINSDTSLISAALAAEPPSINGTESTTSTTITTPTTSKTTSPTNILIIAATVGVAVTAGVILQLKKKEEAAAAAPRMHDDAASLNRRAPLPSQPSVAAAESGSTGTPHQRP